MTECKECGVSSHLFNEHNPACSQYTHYVDDHYDSPCMRGTCKYCNPEYEKKITITVTEREKYLLTSLVQKEIAGICGDLGYQELARLLEKLY